MTPGMLEPPSQAIEPIPIARAVDEIELRLKTITPRRKGYGNCEIPGTGMEIRRKFFPEAVLRPAAFGKGDNLIRRGSLTGDS